MKLLELKDSIVKKIAQKPWIFTGLEMGIMEIYINQIAKVFEAEIVRIASVGEAIIDNKQDKLFNKGKKIYVVKEDKEFIKNEDLWKLVDDQLSDLNIILIYPVIDGRTSFSKYFQQQVVEFKCLDAEQLSKYIIKNTGLEPERAKQLAINCGLDYLTCLMEQDKLLNYAKVFKLPINRAYDEALSTRLLCVRWDDLFNDFVKAVVERRIGEALGQWEHLKEYGESEFKALIFIYTQFKNLLLMLSGSRLNPFFESQLTVAVKNYDLEEVEIIVETIQKLERDVKLGRIEIGNLFDYLLCSIG